MKAKRSETFSSARLLGLINLDAFLRWWGQGLLLWLPQRLQRMLTPAPVKLVIELRGDEIVLNQEKGGSVEELQRYPRIALENGSLTLPLARERQVVLRLREEDTLSRTVTLPLAAEVNLYQVVGFEIDRLTPFPIDKIYYDVALIERQPAVRSLQARFTVVLRSVLDQLVRQLQSAGLAPDRVDTACDPGSVNLLPPMLRPRRSRAALRVRWALLALILLTLGGAALLPIWQQRNVLLALLPEVAALQQQAEAVATLRDQLDAAIESSRFLLQKRVDNALIIDIMNELTLILPDNTWVEQVIIRGNEVQIRGQSQEAASLIGLMEASELFAQPNFQSPITPDNRTGRDRFFLSARITKTNPS